MNSSILLSYTRELEATATDIPGDSITCARPARKLCKFLDENDRSCACEMTARFVIRRWVTKESSFTHHQSGRPECISFFPLLVHWAGWRYGVFCQCPHGITIELAAVERPLLGNHWNGDTKSTIQWSVHQRISPFSTHDPPRVTNQPRPSCPAQSLLFLY